MWTHLERQTGGIGVRGGPGERQIEVDRRVIHRRIEVCKEELGQIERQRDQIVRSHRGFFTASLVGYTNAGKSTLLTALTGERAFAEDRLFATLDTKTRAMILPGGHRILLSDTVGFIRQLPPKLIASFHATLAETRAADLLLHVVDFSSPVYPRQVKVVEETLRPIGCGEKPTLLVLNKIDLLTDRAELRLLLERHPEAVAVSAATGEGRGDLREALRERALAGTVERTLAVRAADGRTLSFLEEHSFVSSREYAVDRTLVRLRIHPGHLARLEERDGFFTVREEARPQGRKKRLKRGKSGG